MTENKKMEARILSPIAIEQWNYKWIRFFKDKQEDEYMCIVNGSNYEWNSDIAGVRDIR